LRGHLVFGFSLQLLLFILVVIIVTTIGFLIIFPISHTTTTQTKIKCELNNSEEIYYIKVRDDGEILEKTGNEKIFNIIDISKLTTLSEMFHAIQDYYTNQNGIFFTID
jgi:hypothetical protein